MARRGMRRGKRAPGVPYACGIGLVCTLFAMFLNPRTSALSEGINFSPEPSQYPDFVNEGHTPARTRARGRRMSDDECTIALADDDDDSKDDSEILNGYPKMIDEEDQPVLAVFVSILIMFLMFYGLAVACDEYFSPALEVISATLGMEDDVAGATFMAAGGSAPELATSILGTLVSESDVGIGTIVGSAVFNVLFVIAVCAILGKPNMELSWYPLARDCIYYCFSILVLVMFVLDQEVQLWEAIVLFLLYIGYCTVMVFNPRLRALAEDYKETGADPKPEGLSKLIWIAFGKTDEHCWSGFATYFIYLVIIVNTVCTFFDEDELTWAAVINHSCNAIYIAECLIKNYGYGPVVFWSSGVDAFDGVLVVLILVEYLVQADGVAGAFRGLKFFRFLRFLRFLRVAGAAAGISKISKKVVPAVDDDAGGKAKQEAAGDGEVAADAPQADDTDADDGPKKNTDADDGGGENDDDDDEPFYLWSKEREGHEKVIFVVTLPLVVLLYYTVPDCRKEAWKGWWFILTFTNCIVWIAILAYVMVWQASVLGVVTNIPQPVMGLTLLAAGTSIPDALSSLNKAKEGLGDMAISSSVGSNIFDILVGLPIPWMLYCILHYPKTVCIQSTSIGIMVMTLFVMVAMVVCGISMSKWKLTKKLGLAFGFLYLIFVVESLLLEYGVLKFE